MSTSSRENLCARTTAFALMSILAAAALLRLPGYLYPLPLHYDEMAEIVSATYLPPAGTRAHPYLNRYLLLALEGSYYVFGRILGWFPSEAAFKLAMHYKPASFLIIGRTLAVLAGLGTILATFELGRRLHSRLVGLVAAALLAIAPAHIVISINLRPWALATAFATLTLLLLVLYSERRRARDLVAAAMAGGMAAASVYTMFLLALPGGYVVLRTWGREPRERRWLWFRTHFVPAVAAGVSLFVLADIQAIVGWKRVVEAITHPTASMLSDGPFDVGYIGNAWLYLRSPFEPAGTGALIAVLASVGLAAWAIQRHPHGIPLLLFVVGVFVIQPLAVVLVANRYTVPAYPALTVAAAYALLHIAERFAPAFGVSARLGIALVGAFVAALPASWQDQALIRSLLRVPTRELARNWIENNVPEGTRLALGIRFMSPILIDCSDVGEMPAWVRGRSPCYDIVHSRRGESVFEAALSAGARLAVHTRTTPEAIARRFALKDAIDDVPQTDFQLLEIFSYGEESPEDTATPNPPVYIFRRMKNGPVARSQPCPRLPCGPERSSVAGNGHEVIAWSPPRT